MRTVLIFAHECAPYNRPESTIGAQRPAQFAKCLPEFGWRAIVICRDAAQDRCWDRVSPDELERTVRDSLEAAADDASVIIPIPSLTHDGTIDRLWQWTNHELPRANRLAGLLRKGLTTLKFCTGDYSQSWQPCARGAAEEVARRVRIDCCIGEHSPDAGLFLARWFSEAHRVPWVADFRDPALRSYGGVAWSLLRSLFRWQLRSAAAIVNVTPLWVELDARELTRPARLIPNGFDPREFGGPKVMGKSEEPLTVAYAGNINGGSVDPLRGMRVFLAGLSTFARRRGREEGGSAFRFFGSAWRKVVELAENAGARDLVAASPAIPRDDVLPQLLKADVLLVISCGGVAGERRYDRQGCYPGKVFEYFGARRPILCVPGDDGQLDALIAETGTGLTCRTADDVAAFLREAAMRKREAGPATYSPNEDALAQYTRQAGARKLARLLDEIVVGEAN
jgi:glycosyltransferase involved in cell wall biosynthesis